MERKEEAVWRCEISGYIGDRSRRRKQANNECLPRNPLYWDEGATQSRHVNSVRRHGWFDLNSNSRKSLRQTTHRWKARACKVGLASKTATSFLRLPLCGRDSAPPAKNHDVRLWFSDRTRKLRYGSAILHGEVTAQAGALDRVGPKAVPLQRAIRVHASPAGRKARLRREAS